MTAQLLPAIRPPLKLLRATLQQSNLRIIICLKMMMQVALPLLITLREESVDVGQLVIIHILEIVVRLQQINYKILTT